MLAEMKGKNNALEYSHEKCKLTVSKLQGEVETLQEKERKLVSTLEQKSVEVSTLF